MNSRLPLLIAALLLVGGALLPSAGWSQEPAEVEDDQEKFRKILELTEWDESRFAKFSDNTPMSVDETYEAWRLAQRLDAFDSRIVSRRHAPAVDLENIHDAPQQHRGSLIALKGTALKTVRVLVPTEEVEQFRYKAFYTTTVKVGDRTVDIISPGIPERWKKIEKLKEPVECAGVLVKLAGDGPDSAVALFVTNHLAWMPDQVNPPIVNYGMGILSVLGMDLSALDSVTQRKPLGAGDSKAFYEMLQCMKKSSPVQLQRSADRQMREHRKHWKQKLAKAIAQKQPKDAALAKEVLRQADEGRYSIAPFFNMPANQVGKIASFEGVVHRALRVQVEPDAEFGADAIDHYYEIALFTGDSQNHPIFFCVLELPKGFPEGENLREPVQVAGFFLKSWRYYSRGAASARQREILPDTTVQLMFAPMFVGKSPMRMAPSDEDSISGWLGGLGFVAVLGVLWLVLWRQSKADRAFAAGTLARVKQPAEPIEFPDGIEPTDREAGAEEGQ